MSQRRSSLDETTRGYQNESDAEWKKNCRGFRDEDTRASQNAARSTE